MQQQQQRRSRVPVDHPLRRPRDRVDDGPELPVGRRPHGLAPRLLQRVLGPLGRRPRRPPRRLRDRHLPLRRSQRHPMLRPVGALARPKRGPPRRPRRLCRRHRRLCRLQVRLRGSVRRQRLLGEVQRRSRRRWGRGRGWGHHRRCARRESLVARRESFVAVRGVSGRGERTRTFVASQRADRQAHAAAVARERANTEHRSQRVRAAGQARAQAVLRAALSSSSSEPANRRMRRARWYSASLGMYPRWWLAHNHCS